MDLTKKDLITIMQDAEDLREVVRELPQTRKNAEVALVLNDAPEELREMFLYLLGMHEELAKILSGMLNQVEEIAILESIENDAVQEKKGDK